MFHIHMYIFRRHGRKFIDKYVNMRGKLTVSDVKGCYSQSGTLQQQVNGNINWVAFIFKNSFCIRINFKGISIFKVVLEDEGERELQEHRHVEVSGSPRTEIELFISVGQLRISGLHV